MTASNARRCGLLIAAHGERGGGCRNASITRLVAELAARNVAAGIGYGLVKGTPTVGAALNRLAASEIFVYPMFLADGYFTRTALPRLLEEAPRREGRSIRILPALGLDPALAELIAVKAASVAQANRYGLKQTTLVLLAHGSSQNSASRIATEGIADRARQCRPFNGVRVAFLDEPPSLNEATLEISGPIVVVGLFAGNGLHGADDVSRMMTALRRNDVVFAGNVAAFPELADVVAAAVDRDLVKTLGIAQQRDPEKAGSSAPPAARPAEAEAALGLSTRLRI